MGEHELSLPVLYGLDIHLNLVAGLELGIVAELGNGDHALALSSDVHHHLTLGDCGDLTLYDLVLHDLRESLVVCLLDGLPVLGAAGSVVLERIPVEILGIN